MNNKGKINSIILVVSLLGVLVVAGGGNLSQILGLGELAGTVFIPIGSLIIGLVLGFMAPPTATVLSLLLSAYAAICFGDFVDMLIDWFVRNRDRNLFPLELVLLAILAFVPVLIGITVGRKIKGMNLRTPNKSIHTDAG
jgi:hypothetical protein